MSTLDLGLIGNCRISALINPQGEIVWSCMPRFDSDPVFCALLDNAEPERQHGLYAIDLVDASEYEQRYLPNTPIMVTTKRDIHGNVLEIIDFAPRFKKYERTFRPVMLVRRMRAVHGSPQVRIRLRPSFDYGAGVPDVTVGSNHLRYLTGGLILRLTSDCSVTAVAEEVPFVLEEEATLLLGPDEPMESPVAATGTRFFQETMDYWHGWVRHLAIPFEWQDDVIRAAITLKLSSFDDTGAVVAAMTTSIPEARDMGRHWDYRYCWVRDAYFVVNALNRLGATRTMEHFLHYIINLVAGMRDSRLQPVYQINGRPELEERVIDSLPGYRGLGTVRVGNQAYRQHQHDVYGAAVMAAAHLFFDRRLKKPGETALFHRLEGLGHIATELYQEPDAGPWELRNSVRIHTFSSVMCWAACDRLARIAGRLNLNGRSRYWRTRADMMHRTICRRAWNEEMGSFVESFDGSSLDASLLLLHDLGFLSADDPRFAATVAAVGKHLRRGNFLFRYTQPDDIGEPQTAFLICSFWYVNALADLGRAGEAREHFEHLLACRNRHGLLPEDIDPDTGELWGNFPQTYSMVGLIRSAMRLSMRWDDAF